MSHSVMQVLLEAVDSPGPTGSLPSKGTPWRQGWASAAGPWVLARAAPFHESCPGESGAGGTPLPSPPATAGPSAAFAHTKPVSSHSPMYPSIPSREAFALTVPSTWSGLSLYFRLLDSYNTQLKSYPLHPALPGPTLLALGVFASCLHNQYPQCLPGAGPPGPSTEKRTRLRSLP